MITFSHYHFCNFAIGEHQPDRIDQLLTPTQQNLPLQRGQNITFIGVQGEFDFSLIGCGTEWRYLCFDIGRGDNPVPSFNVRIPGRILSSPIFTSCTDRCAHIDGKGFRFVFLFLFCFVVFCLFVCFWFVFVFCFCFCFCFVSSNISRL